SFRPKRVTSAAMEILQQHRWKGNIRELRNTVERLLIMTRSDVIDVADLRDMLRTESRQPVGLGAAASPVASNPSPPAAGPVGAPSAAPPGSAAEPPVKPGTLREFKEAAERTFLVEKLRENGWNISRTAEVIGTPRSNLYKKLEQYQISQERDS